MIPRKKKETLAEILEELNDYVSCDNCDEFILPILEDIRELVDKQHYAFRKYVLEEEV